MPYERKTIPSTSPLCKCNRCGFGSTPYTEQIIYTGAAERFNPAHYIKCPSCGIAIGGTHMSASEAAVRWNSRMCS